MKTRPPKKKKTKYIPPHCIPKVVISAEEADENAADDEDTDLEANGTEPADVRNGTSVPSEPPANGIKTNGTAAAAAEGTEAEEISDLYAQRLPGQSVITCGLPYFVGTDWVHVVSACVPWLRQ